MQNVNVLNVKMQNGKLSATINGQPVTIPEPTDEIVDMGDDARICIAALFPDTHLTLIVTDLKIRNLAVGQ
jgi:hypothetical protein